MRAAMAAWIICTGLLSVAIKANAQPMPKEIAARVELHAIPTLTLSDQQFLNGDANGKPVTVAGEFRIAQGTGRLPVVVLMHGSSGVGPNIEPWVHQFNAMGISTFVIDGFSGRGLTAVGPNQALLGRLNLILDIYRSLDILAKHPRVDPDRIVLMGFSRGGRPARSARAEIRGRIWLHPSRTHRQGREDRLGLTPASPVVLFPRDISANRESGDAMQVGMRAAMAAWIICTGLLPVAIKANAQPMPKEIASRVELHAIPTLTLSDQQFLTGDANGKPVTVAGEFRIAQGTGRLPVVVLMHGSSGVGPNIEPWVHQFNAMGISTFVIDGFSGRGLTAVGPNQALLGRLNLILDIYRSLDILAKHPRVDPDRIVLMGFSRGGQAALYASLDRFNRLWNKSGVAVRRLHSLLPGLLHELRHRHRGCGPPDPDLSRHAG